MYAFLLYIPTNTVLRRTVVYLACQFLCDRLTSCSFTDLIIFIIFFLTHFSQWLLYSGWAATEFSTSFSKNSTPQVSRYWANPLQKILHQWPVRGHQAVQVSGSHHETDALKPTSLFSETVTRSPCSLLILPEDVLLGNWGRAATPEVCCWKWTGVFWRGLLKRPLALSLVLKSVWFSSSYKGFNDWD